MNVEVCRRASIRSFLASLRTFWIAAKEVDTPTHLRLELIRRASAQVGKERPKPRPGAEGRKRGSHVTAAVLKMVSRRRVSNIAGSIPS